MRGTDESGRPLKASFVTPRSMDTRASDALADSLTAGASAKLAGYFQPFTDRSGGKHFTMVAMTLETAQGRSEERTGAPGPSGKNTAVAAQAEDGLGDSVRHYRDVVLGLSVERRALAASHASQETKVGGWLSRIATETGSGKPLTYSHVPASVMRDTRNTFLVVEPNERRGAGDPLDRRYGQREIGLFRNSADGEIYAEDITRGRTGIGLRVAPLSLATNAPDDPREVMWGDLRRNDREAAATPVGMPRSFVVLPLSGPVAQRPEFVAAAVMAQQIRDREIGTVQYLAAISDKLGKTAGQIGAISDAVFELAMTAAKRHGPSPDAIAALDVVGGMRWRPAADRYSDPLTARRPGDGVAAANVALNALPLSQAIVAQVTANGRDRWTEILDMPETHPQLTRSTRPGPIPRIEIRGSRDIGDSGSGGTTTDLFDAIKRHERTALAMGVTPSDGHAFDRLNPGDVIRLHRARRGDAPGGYLDLMVTDHPRRLGRETSESAIEIAAREQRVSPDVLRAEAARKGQMAHVSVRVIASDAIERPQRENALARPTGVER